MKKLSISLLLSLLICACFMIPASAAEYTAKVGTTNYAKIKTNTSYSSKTTFKAGAKLEITCEENITSFYVVWYSTPKAWTLDEKTTIDNGMLHQYIKLDNPAKTFSITMPDEKTGMCYLKVFTEGEEVPAEIQQWNAPTENVDVMVFATHADDECLFFGAAIATIKDSYPDANIQIVTFTNHISAEPYREHERLDAIWALGLTNYPIVGDVTDAYSTTLEGGLKSFDYDTKLQEYVDLINKYKPQVILTHDFNGEYGHGQHMAMTKVVVEAVQTAAKDGFKVSKLYVHLAEDNQISIDVNTALNSYNGQTAKEVAEAAYLKHASQQRWTAFYVTDNSDTTRNKKYDCTKWGLYITNVGNDTGTDLLEHVKTYATQAAEAAAAQAAAEKKEAEQASEEHQEVVETGIKISKVVLAVVFVVVLILIVIVVKIIKKVNANAYKPKHAGPKK